MAEFIATLIGAAVGVVAGTAIQYCVQLLLTRRARQKMLDDLKIEAQLNLNVAEQMLAEVARFRPLPNQRPLLTIDGSFAPKT